MGTGRSQQRLRIASKSLFEFTVAPTSNLRPARPLSGLHTWRRSLPQESLCLLQTGKHGPVAPSKSKFLQWFQLVAINRPMQPSLRWHWTRRVSCTSVWLRMYSMSNAVVHIGNPSILQAKARGSLQVRGQPGLHGESEDSLDYKIGTLSQNKHT